MKFEGQKIHKLTNINSNNRTGTCNACGSISLIKDGNSLWKCKNDQKIKQYYTVKLEATAPVTLIYRVLAESPEQAVDLISPSTLTSTPITKLAKIQKIKASIYLSGTNLLQFLKNFK